MFVSHMKAIVAGLVVVIGFTAGSCKKHHDAVSSAVINDSTVTSARDIYLWYNNIPASFNASSFANPSDIMNAIRAFSSEPGYTTPVDRWSFAMLKTDWDN